MTSKISLVRLARQKLSQNIWLVAATLITLFFSTTLVVFMEATNKNWQENYITLENFSSNVCGLLLQNFAISSITIGAAFIIPMVLFKYINSKSEVDFYHSLPIKREKFFIVNYVLGILIFAIPFLLNIALSVLSIFANLPFTEGFSHELGNLISTILVSFIAVYSVNVFAIIVTGNIFMSAATSLGFMFLPYAVTTLSLENFNIFSRFFYLDSSISLTVLSHTNPLFHLMDLYSLSSNKILIGCIINTLIYTIFAFLLYKIRRSENASNPVAINFLKPVIKFIGVFGATLIGAYMFYVLGRESILWFCFGSILVAFIIHCAFEIIYESDFKALFHNFKHFLIYAVIFSFLILGASLDIFGYDKKLPVLDEIESVEVSFERYIYSENTRIFTEFENIEIVHKLAEICINQTEDTDSNQYYYIKYTMKDGKTIERQYKNIDIEVAEPELYYDLVLSPECISQMYKFSNLDEINVEEIDFNSNIFSGDDILEIYSLFLEENSQISYDYYKSNIPCVNFILRYVTEDENSLTLTTSERIYVYEAHEKTLEALLNLHDELYYDFEVTNAILSLEDADGITNTVLIDDVDLLNKISDDTINCSDFFLSSTKIFYSDQNVILVTLRSEEGERSPGYINPTVFENYYNEYFND